MRTVIIIIAFVLAMGMANVQAEIIWDSGHHVFSEGSETYVTMLNDASADITGGWIWEFHMLNDTTADITGGEIGQLLCYDTSEVFVYEPSEIDLLRPNDSSTANVYGGTINGLFTLGDSVTNIYEASLNFVDAVDSSTINMYVESYNWNPTGGKWGDGLLTGIWLNTSHLFSIEIIDLQTINHINFVPEPSMMSLLVIGSLMLRTIKRKTRR